MNAALRISQTSTVNFGGHYRMTPKEYRKHWSADELVKQA